MWKNNGGLGALCPRPEKPRVVTPDPPQNPAAVTKIPAPPLDEMIGYGGRWVRVRDGAKVMCHLIFGLVALTATALLARLC